LIVSHRHRFIYIKTYKTASSSIETALSAVLGEEDIITPARPDLSDHRSQAKGGQNYRLEHPDVPKIPLWRKLLRRPERYYHPTVGYYEHMPAWRVRRYVGEEIWRSYYKFTFERNPWDRQVSWYHYKTRNFNPGAKPSFASFNADRRRARVVNWDLYTADGDIVMDFLGRYENLSDDFLRVLKNIGLADKISLPKVNRSQVKAADYRTYYNDESREMIARWYRPEIIHFSYEF
jgi:Sulfotransferase family